MENVQLTPSDFIALTNQTLEYAYPSVEVVGEVQGFKVNQNKYVFFDLKDEKASVGCFMTVWQMRTPLEDGMKVIVKAQPRLTKWGKFSLTVSQVIPQGEGSIKRSFALLVTKLEKEGLFDAARKRPLPAFPSHIGVIASTESAGYADFVKIINQRWGGLKVEVAHVQVQGMGASEQAIRALRYFEELEQPPEAIVMMRGGGSLDDLSSFNDEPLARAIARSRVPVITGIGHETDTTLADMVADVRAATPSNAAQILVPDASEIKRGIHAQLKACLQSLQVNVQISYDTFLRSREHLHQQMEAKYRTIHQELNLLHRTLQQLHPETVLKRGYAIVKLNNGKLIDQSVREGESLSIELEKTIITAGVTHVEKRK